MLPPNAMLMLFLTPCMHVQSFLPMAIFVYVQSHSSLLLISSSSLLTRLQLVEIVSANRHVALVLVHALREALDVLRTRSLRLALALRLAVVEAVVHGLSVGVGGLLVLLLLGGRGRAPAEEAAEGVANGGSDCYTAVDRR